MAINSVKNTDKRVIVKHNSNIHISHFV